MIRLLLIRHGATAWNEAGRIQGRSDPPLSPAGRDTVAAWTPPAEAAGARWMTSPLARARETAEILHGAPVAQEPRLIETDWGDWEGKTLRELRQALGSEMAENEARGLDFRPPGGESPRDVQRRVLALLKSLAETAGTVVAITHKGVIRAVYALASDWDMRARPPVKLRDGCAQVFTLSGDGHPSVAALNIPLEAACRRQ